LGLVREEVKILYKGVEKPQYYYRKEDMKEDEEEEWIECLRNDSIGTIIRGRSK